jgi:uncharacterized coiled-coil DUF342 family protein
MTNWAEREQQLISLIDLLRERNAELTELLETVTSERAEDQAELRRHHDHFQQVSELAAGLNGSLVNLARQRTDLKELERARSRYLTPIRNIVG